MIHLPQRVVRGQVLTADHINRIHATLAALRPIAGQGILLKETGHGVVISASATAKKAAQSSVPVAWQVRKGAPVAEENAGEGSESTPTWQVYSPLCSSPAGEFLPDGMVAEDWNDLPQNVLSGNLYAVIDLSDSDPVCTLERDVTFPPDSGKIAIRIGVFTLDTGSNTTTFAQDHVGVLHLGGQGSVMPPIAWQVRKAAKAESEESESPEETPEETSPEEATPPEEEEEAKDVWQVFCPLWSLPGSLLYPLAFSDAWNDLPTEVVGSTPSDKTLYAALYHAPATQGDRYTEPTQEVTEVRLLTALPDTENPEVEGESYHLIPIGKWDEDGNWTQFHLGVLHSKSPTTIVAANQLGPIERVYVGGDAVQFVHYLGNWEQSSTGWNFAHATDENGEELPPVYIYESAREVNALIRSDNNTDGEPSEAIAQIKIATLFNDGASDWLYKQTADITKVVNYTEPEDELQEGELSATSSTITFWSTSPVAVGEKTTLLTTVVEDANEGHVYE